MIKMINIQFDSQQNILKLLKVHFLNNIIQYYKKLCEKQNQMMQFICFVMKINSLLKRLSRPFFLLNIPFVFK